MSQPLLQTSPTVALEVGTDRRLRADVIPNPATHNALKVNATGLYAKEGTPDYPWQLAMQATQSIFVTTQTDQVISWNLEVNDPDGLVDLTSQPTRVTFPETGRYFQRCNVTVQLQGGTAQAMSAILWLRKNGSIYAGGAWASKTLAAGDTNIAASYSGLINLAAGDYLEACWRWLGFGANTALTANVMNLNTSLWNGFRWRAIA